MKASFTSPRKVGKRAFFVGKFVVVDRREEAPAHELRVRLRGQHLGGHPGLPHAAHAGHRDERRAPDQDRQRGALAPAPEEGRSRRGGSGAV
jgi:hypothetical protein